MPSPPNPPTDGLRGGAPTGERAVLGLGSNLGDRWGMLHAAADRLRAACGEVRASSVYESAALGPPQPAYLNAAVLVRWPHGPRALLDLALQIERDLGRERRERWGPRTIDIDVLWIDGVSVDEPGLAVPHAELLVRPFAIVPLLEVAPDAVDPRTGSPFVRPTSSGLSVVAPPP